MLHHLELTLSPTDPTVLERILTLCRSRRCAVTALRFVGEGDVQRAWLSVDAEPHRVALLTARIDSLIGVLATASVASADPIATTR